MSHTTVRTYTAEDLVWVWKLREWDVDQYCAVAGTTPASAAVSRHKGEGPRFFRQHGKIRYRRSDYLAWQRANVKPTNQTRKLNYAPGARVGRPPRKAA